MKFSVIIPAYNSEKYIRRSIESVLNQSYNNYEIIVIDDGSKDKTYEIAKTYESENVKIVTKKNEGVSAARNDGIEMASGDYVCFLDTDDQYYENHLAVLNRAIDEHTDCEIFSTMNSICLLSGKIRFPHNNGAVYVSEDAVYDLLYGNISVWTCCMCVKKKAFEKYGMFCVGVKHGEDRDMWERIYVHGKLVFIKVTTVQRNRDGSKATKINNRNWIEFDTEKRLESLIADDSISSKIKESLKTSNEWHKLSDIRTLILQGQKREAYDRYKAIEKSRIPFSRRASTLISLFVPIKLLRIIIDQKYKGYYV